MHKQAPCNSCKLPCLHSHRCAEPALCQNAPLAIGCVSARCLAWKLEALGCCAVLCCAVLCCAVLYCAVLCCAVLCHPVYPAGTCNGFATLMQRPWTLESHRAHAIFSRAITNMCASHLPQTGSSHHRAALLTGQPCKYKSKWHVAGERATSRIGSG